MFTKRKLENTIIVYMKDTLFLLRANQGGGYFTKYLVSWFSMQTNFGPNRI